MTPEEVEKFRVTVRRSWLSYTTPQLYKVIELNERLLEQIKIRNQVLREIIDERKSDFKSKQFSDRNN